MKNSRLLLNCIIMGAATAVLAVVLSLYISSTGTIPAADNAAGSAAAYADGVYTASAQGCLSEVSVTVSITGGKVSDVEIDASGETPELGGRAAALLAGRLAERGSAAGVDAIAGSTVTSEAVFAAMRACLAQAAK